MTDDRGLNVDPSREQFSGKTKKMVAVVDTLGFTNKRGYVEYVDRGTEVDLPVEEIDRLTRMDVANGVFPAVVPPKHPGLPVLLKPIPTSENPDLARIKIAQAHGLETPLSTPAMESTSEPSDTPPLASPAGAAPAIDYAALKKDTLVDIAKAQGLDTSGTKDDIVARLQGGAPADVTPRVGDTDTGDDDESTEE